MARNVARLDPSVVERSKEIIFNPKLTQAQMAKKLGIDRRWIVELRRYHKLVEHGVEEPVHGRQSADDKLLDRDELFIEEYRRLTADTVPPTERVKILRSILKDGKLADKIRVLDKLDSLAGIGKDKLPDKPVPLYRIDASEEPDYRKVDFRNVNTADLWLDDWAIYNPEDGTVSITIHLGPVEEEHAQKILRALTSGVNVGIRGRKTERVTVDGAARGNGE